MFLRNKNQNQNGFTLIELLVVIAIIGLIASVVLSALGTARIKARDTKRIADMSQIMKALELYYSANSSYPLSGPAGDGGGWSSSTDSSWDVLQTKMASSVSKLPTDPSQVYGTAVDSIINGPNYGYAYFAGFWGGCTTGQFYILVFKQEKSTLTSPDRTWCQAGWGTPPNYNIAAGAQNNITYMSESK